MKKDPNAFARAAEPQQSSVPHITTEKEAIAVIGFALKFPQDVTSEESLWKLLMERRSTKTEVPSNRWNLEGFYKPHGNRPGTVNSRGGHFIADDPARFDAPFFSIQPAEAECMDPQQRFLLETSYHALENAGIPMEAAMGTRTSVHVGCLLQEYSQISQRDTDMPGSYQIVGSSGLSMLANRLSWFYDFTGPSMTVDTACSGSLLAVHLACQDLLLGTVDMALACGSNLSLVPDSTALLSALNMMSPDSTCYSFDERANGYSRSEGFGVMLLKRLSRAIDDGDTIRGIIRSTGCNQDGHTPGITQPSQAAQERLTRETYESAGLDLDVTRYFEAHGTGTVVGDPIEAGAISNVFGTRTADDPLYIGALKSNIGHPEAASGIAGIIKAVLVLETGVIPPNMYPERINPVIASSCANLKFPLTPTLWPTQGVRRASVNSFGYGGTNVHIVMDDVLSYTESHRLNACHHTQSLEQEVANGSNDHVDSESSLIDTPPEPGSPVYALLMLSAFDDYAVGRSISSLEEWLRNRNVPKELLEDLAYTLTTKRSSFPWKTFAVVSSDTRSSLIWSKPTRVKQTNRVCFVLTGQGAIWHGMGRELLRYKTFRETVSDADRHLKSLGSPWSAMDELYGTSSYDSVHRPDLSQALCTIVQVAIIDLLSFWNIYPFAVVGHSSGEIAAAYASGAISRQSAWMIAYFRGLAVAITGDLLDNEGSMVAVQAAQSSIAQILEQYNAQYESDPVVVACYNSPSNLTLSGSRKGIDRFTGTLAKSNITFRVLKIDVAYHSSYMNPVARVYNRLLHPIESGGARDNSPLFFSTVTGELLEDTSVLRTCDYWMRNLTGPVQFSNAVETISNVDSRQTAGFFVEIGPHSTLRSPIRDILKNHERDIETEYGSILVRDRAADLSALECIGKLVLAGAPVNLAEINGPRRNLITTLSPYPFNDKTRYWLEGRTSAQYRFRKHVHNEFLGTRVDDWNECEARWTNRITLDQSPWLKDHQVNGLIIFPAAGFLVMALEALRQMYCNEERVLAYKMRDVKFSKAVTLTEEHRGTELQLTLRTAQPHPPAIKSENHWDQFVIFVYENGKWVECCSGAIAVKYVAGHDDPSNINESTQLLGASVQSIKNALGLCKTVVQSSDIYGAFARAGLVYGPFFQAMHDVHWNGKGQAVGAVDIHQWKTIETCTTDPHLIHPTALDAIFQITFPAYSIYAKNASATTIPTGFQSAWFSAAMVNTASASKALVHAQVTKQGFRNKLFSITAALEGSTKPIFTGEMETSTIGSGDSFLEVDSKPLYRIEYTPDVDLLPSQTLYLEPSPMKDLKLIRDKELLCLSSMQNALARNSDIPLHLPVHLQDYVQWMKIKISTHENAVSESVESMCQRLESADVEARLLVRVAKNLASILAGETDPLDLLFKDDILSEFYSNFHSNQQLLSRAAVEVDNMAHKYPSMRVLEIGAGTGSATEHILAALGDRVSEYVYTDVTPSFFLKAKERFGSSKLVFKTLDISQDPLKQGYEEGNFDLIIAANVLHAANGIRNSLVQCCKLLRPNGRILLLEMTNREHLLEPYIFGLLPGLSREASPESAKNNSPLLTESEWAEELLETGFSGIDTCISDAGFITEHSISTIMISRAVAPRKSSGPSLHVIYDEGSAMQRDLLQHLEHSLVPGDNMGIVPVTWSAVENGDVSQSTCVFLVDSTGDFLGRLREDELKKLKNLLEYAKALIWATFNSSTVNESPTAGLVPGLARTLATENENCRVISVTLDASSSVTIAAANILKITDMLMQTQGVPEDEYVEQNGLLCIPRVMLDRSMAAQIFATTHTVTKPWNELNNPCLTIGTVGRLNTLHFEQAVPSNIPLALDEVIIEVKAVGLSSRDLLVAQGQVYEEFFGGAFAGVVLQLSVSQTHTFEIGDRVFGITPKTMVKQVRCKSYQMQKIPADMDICEAATYPIAFCTAYYSLIYAARVKKGESVLIHQGAGVIGQVMIQLAQLYGCEVFITVEQAEQATLLHETYKIPRSQILSCHTLGFGKNIQRLTGGYGVDVVVGALTGEATRESWECLASFGRYIDIGETGSISNLPMERSRMFVGVNIHELAQNPRFGEVFDEVAQLIAEKKLKPPKILQVFKQNKVEAAFQLLQHEKLSGSVVIELAGDEEIEMVLAPSAQPLFNSEASYLLAGAFGGIGQSVAQWMVQNGAKNLILPSRNAVEGTGSLREDFVKDLRARGAIVKAPLCDIADRAQLEQALWDCSDMPPIKGCIQAAMVVRDSSFANMSIDDWHASLAPKLTGSWNLHQLLPSDLDFFIMFSSSTGIMGSFGQSNYTAGNTYQDALAAHRVRHRQRAHSIAMSMVTGVGWVAENAQVQALLKVRGMLEEVSLEDIYELLRYCCNPEHVVVGPQIITPLSLPADLRALGIVEPLGSTRPIYSYLHTLPSRDTTSADSVGAKESKQLPSVSLQGASTLAEATDIITEAIQNQLSSLLVVSKDDIDPKKPIHKYGVDSLVAVEMRNWFAKGVGADVATIEILGEAGIAELAGRVAKKSKYVKEELRA